jgi:serine/threonine protein kinase/Tol biopolymer transport system component
MPIEPGSRIGPYEVTSHLGEGAMGVVFRAHDTKLQRDVALKLLPENFAKEPERLTRFQREAQLLASLNHPNIAHIYGLEEVDGSGCIVMELVEGETISERLKRTGPLPIDEAVAVAKQIAQALAAAHERGIVHRDLKPANIKLTPNGTVKVLDFGLAKALGAKSQDINVSSLPTLASGSIAGSIVGTIGYMSPEQARGRQVDARADIWAFGCVLYEMLTAHMAFEGETSTDVMARIVNGEPDLGLLPKETPQSIRLLLNATLNKNPEDRLQHIGDMRLFLDETFFPRRGASGEQQASSSRGKLLTAVLAVLLIIALIPAVLYFRRPSADSPAMRFELSLPGLFGNSAVVSPDGRRIAFVAQTAEGQRNLWVRGIGDEAPQQLRGTENVTGMFWSPDSRFLAFAADRELKKIDASGNSSPQVICDLPGAQGATWGRDGVILFGRISDHVIVRLSDSGGEIKPVTSLDASRKETTHGNPVFLPDGNHFLYAGLSSIPENSGIFITSLDGKTTPNRILPSPLFRFGGLGYAQGFLLLMIDGKLTAQRFDESALKLEGEATPIAEGAENGFTASRTGILTYRKVVADAANKQLTWFDRTGKLMGELGAPSNYGGIELSPSGDRVAVDITSNNNRDIWVLDLARGIPARITFDPAPDWSAKWSPDGSRVIFASANRTGTGNQIYQKSSSGVGNDEVVSPEDAGGIPVDWTSDNKYIVYSRFMPRGAGNDTWLLPLLGDRKPKPFLQSPFDKVLAQVSPDSRWIAYTTNESGTFQIFVQSFPDPNGGKWQISADGGVEPKWRRDGRELYYIAFDGKLMAVPLKVDRTFEADKPVPLFQTGLTVNRTRPDRDRRYDVTRDGRFLFVMPGRVTAAPITVLVNWSAGLK